MINKPRRYLRSRVVLIDFPSGRRFEAAITNVRAEVAATPRG